MTVSSYTGRLATSIAGTLLLALSGTVFAAPPASTPAGPTKEMREKMALLHEQMAACLRSDKSLAECRAEMQKSCSGMMGDQGCTRMMGTGAGMMGTGRMHRGMASGTPCGPAPPK